jgi:hypothetical protein
MNLNLNPDNENLNSTEKKFRQNKFERLVLIFYLPLFNKPLTKLKIGLIK